MRKQFLQETISVVPLKRDLFFVRRLPASELGGLFSLVPWRGLLSRRSLALAAAWMVAIIVIVIIMTTLIHEIIRQFGRRAWDGMYALDILGVLHPLEAGSERQSVGEGRACTPLVST